MRDVAVKYWAEATLILPPTSGSLLPSFEPFLVHAKKLQQERGDELNFLLSSWKIFSPSKEPTCD